MFRESEREFDINLDELYKRLNPLRDLSRLDKLNETTFELIRKTTLRYNGEEFRNQFNPIVYIFWKHLEQNKMYALYVGKSDKGIRRTFYENHDRRNLFEEMDEIEIISCLISEVATKFELQLIKYLKPTHNIQGRKREEKERIILR